MNCIEQNLLLGGERDAQPYRISFATSLPDVARDGLHSPRSVLGAKTPGLGVKSEPEHSLLRLRLDRGAASLANGERRAVEWPAVEMDFQDQGVAAGASTEPVPDDFVGRGSPRLARQWDGQQDQRERGNGEERAGAQHVSYGHQVPTESPQQPGAPRRSRRQFPACSR
jgi:hypothetical protein